MPGEGGCDIIYAMSDIHGCLDALVDQMKWIDLAGGNRVVFLGDYIDYGSDSRGVLQFIMDLQKQFGRHKVVALKGNHEQALLEWIDSYTRRDRPGSGALDCDGWLENDSDTFRSFLSEEQYDRYLEYARTASFEDMNRRAALLVAEGNRELLRWVRAMPILHETPSQIFVHAGVDEEAGEYWKLGTPKAVFLGKYPATFGPFVKTVIAGHIGTGSLAKDRSFHDVYYDGESHYYIDGSVYDGGKLLLLACKNGAYYQVEGGRMIPVHRSARME